MTDIEKKAFEVYPRVWKKLSGDGEVDIMGERRDGYIKACKEYESLPKIHGWLSKDPEDYYVHLSFGGKPDFDGTYWNNTNGPGIMYALPEEMFPEVSTKEPVEVELLIRKITK